jgi:hypothetical protein
MALLQRDPKCLVCAGGGKDTLATTTLSNGTPACGRHANVTARPIKAIPFEQWIKEKREREATKEQETMPARKVIDWDAVQRDRDAGIPVSELEKKYGISNSWIYTKTHANGAQPATNGKRRAVEAGRVDCRD